MARAEVRIADDRGHTVVLESPAARVISLYGGFSEILDAMGLADRLVARTKEDDQFPSLRDKPSVGTHLRPNVELVLSLKPDLVLQLAGAQEALPSMAALEAHGAPVAVFSPASLSSVYSVIDRLGTLLGEPVRAGALIRSMQSRIQAAAHRAEGARTRPNVFVELRYPNLLAAGRTSLADEVVRLAGGEPCVLVDKTVARLGEEALLGLDPDVYVILRGPMNPDPLPLDQRPLYKNLRAVRTGRVLVADQEAFTRPGPRLADAVEQLAAFLHPDSGSGKP